MLTHLYIKNFTLIDELDMDFHAGFSVITGETGAGKSIIVGAVGLLMGGRSDTRQIKTGRQKCIVEATFSIDEGNRSFIKSFFERNEIDEDADECVIRREVSSTGKSRAFVNDTPVTVSNIRALGEKLLDIHSQHQNLMLNEEGFQLNVLDTFANDRDLVESYYETFRAYDKACKELDELRENVKKSSDNEDFLRFQQQELSMAALHEDEQAELERQSEVMTHAEEIKSTLYFADETLNNDERGVVIQLSNTLNQLREIESVYPFAAALRSRIEECYIELKDAARDVSGNMEGVEFDPQELQKVNSRLDQIYSLEKKYGVESTAGLISKLEEISASLSRIQNFDEELEQKKRLVKSLDTEQKIKAEKLTKARIKAAKDVERELSRRLVPLGLPKVRFKIEVTTAAAYSSKGADKVVFMFSSNAGIPLQPISDVASGGEIARVMLSLKAMMSRAGSMPTIIFDEIDTGVSGHIAEKMALIMKEMGDNNRQVICITHLPQIAAVGRQHYKVAKKEMADSTVSTMTKLSPEERVTEIAQMLSGSNVSQAAIDNAKSLLIQNN